MLRPTLALIALFLLHLTPVFAQQTTVEFYQSLDPNSLTEFQAITPSVKLAVASIGEVCLGSNPGSAHDALEQYKAAVDEYRVKLIEESVLSETQAAELDGYVAVEFLHLLSIEHPLDPMLEGDLEPEILPNETIGECLHRTCEDCGGRDTCPWTASTDCPPGQFGFCNSAWPLWGCIFRRHACCVLGGDRC